MPVLKMLLQDNEGPSTKGIGMLRQLMRESLEKRFSKLEDMKLFNQHLLMSHPTPSRLFTPSHSLTLQVVSEGEVLDKLLRLDSRKPAGSDALDSYFFKLLSLQVLLQIFLTCPSTHLKSPITCMEVSCGAPPF